MTVPGGTTDATFLCHREDLVPGGKRAFQVGRLRIVLCRTHEGFFALRDLCPHHGAYLSQGVLGGTNLPSAFGEYHYGRDDEILRCPRHGWEIDVTTGRALHDPEHKRVRTYAVREENGGVYLELDGRPQR